MSENHGTTTSTTEHEDLDTRKGEDALPNGRPSELLRTKPDPDPYMKSCPSWCTDAGRGHRDQTHHDDRRHWGTFHEVELELPQCDGKNDHSILVVMSQHYRAAEPEVRVDVGGNEAVLLTVLEARWLHDRLGTILRVADEAVSR